MLNLPRNIYVMALVMAVSMSSASLMLLISSLLATHIAPDKSLATLPLAMMVIGTAVMTIPASLSMQKIGRKAGLFLATILSMLSALLAMWAAQNANFTALLFAGLGMGMNIAFVQTGRFAILESAENEKQQASGLTLALLAGLLSAFIGPQLGVWGKDWLSSPHGYAGSFLLFAIVQIVTLIALCFFTNPVVKQGQNDSEGRSIWEIIKQPIFIVAAASGAVAYSVMTLVMTATPISMHEFDQHSLASTKWVLQAHMFAMFLPSLLTGMLLTRVNKLVLLLSGLLIYAVMSLFAFAGHAFLHYWWALVLLGLGWNILYVTATAILPKAYKANERFKAQACNDFLIFGFQAIASFSAGWLLFSFGWNGVIWVSLIMITPIIIFLLFLFLKDRHLLQS
jgi:MFS family permease